MTVGTVFLEWVFPLLGGIVGTAMFGAPFKAVLRARKERTLGDLNPIPFAAQTANAAGWIAYTYVLSAEDLAAAALIFWPNHLGLLFGMFFTISCCGLAKTKTRDRQLAIIVFFTFLISLIGAIGLFAQLSQHGLKLLWGFTANAILLLYYTAPLSTIITVFKTRSAATLHAPLAIAQICNGGLWFGYGLAIGDPFVWVPNGIGACTGILLTILLIIFRDKKVRSSPVPSEIDTPMSSARELRLNGPCSSTMGGGDEEAGVGEKVSDGVDLGVRERGNSLDEADAMKGAVLR